MLSISISQCVRHAWCLCFSDFVQQQLMLRDAEQSLKERSDSSLLPSDTPNLHDLTQLVLSCWKSDPNSRPSAEGLQEAPDLCVDIYICCVVVL